ncbi:MAG: hypothetical protein M3405_09015 [Acidobacteriota bacterium]|jgi:hypothetical protein|nr:hypothetical protein [Acidobacteriota bacterium]
MNLTQKQMDAKKAYLDKQQEKMLAQYETVDSKERSEIIGHINSFIETCTKDQKRFWLSFRDKLENLNHKQN